MTIADFNRITIPHNQWLPLDPPDPATLGAIAACASSGPLRFGFGKPRDYVIGLRLAHIDGTESKSGGRVVKNVAGYDMNKLYVGSWGTLAVITELTFKLRPVPERTATVVARSGSIESLIETGRAVMASEIQPVSLTLILGDVSESLGPGPALLVRFADCEEAVEYQLTRLRELLQDDASAGQVEEAEVGWSEVGGADERFRVVARISVPLSKLESLVREAPAPVRYHTITADLGSGELRIGFDADDQAAVDVLGGLRRLAQLADGWLLVERAPLEVRRRIDAFGDPGAAGAIMRSIKTSLDPRGLLSPGRFVSGI
jgi:glycolate oxidase FAD binding subunit